MFLTSNISTKILDFKKYSIYESYYLLFTALQSTLALVLTQQVSQYLSSFIFL
jgi:hypothetical protein